ncbi:MAG: hypothetical protein AAFS10_20580, partial [Myxococcota bacterium]
MDDTLSLSKQHSKPKEQGEEALRVPYLQILYHGNLSQVGGVTLPDMFSDSQWVVLGRHTPFLTQEGSDEQVLGDPYISRKQTAIRWNEALACFEVKPS